MRLILTSSLSKKTITYNTIAIFFFLKNFKNFIQIRTIIPLPKTNLKFIVLRSAFVHKKSREQFGKINFKRKIFLEIPIKFQNILKKLLPFFIKKKNFLTKSLTEFFSYIFTKYVILQILFFYKKKKNCIF